MNIDSLFTGDFPYFLPDDQQDFYRVANATIPAMEIDIQTLIDPADDILALFNAGPPGKLLGYTGTKKAVVFDQVLGF